MGPSGLSLQPFPQASLAPLSPSLGIPLPLIPMCPHLHKGEQLGCCPLPTAPRQLTLPRENTTAHLGPPPWAELAQFTFVGKTYPQWPLGYAVSRSQKRGSKSPYLPGGL